MVSELLKRLVNCETIFPLEENLHLFAHGGINHKIQCSIPRSPKPHLPHWNLDKSPNQIDVLGVSKTQ